MLPERGSAEARCAVATWKELEDHYSKVVPGLASRRLTTSRPPSPGTSTTLWTEASIRRQPPEASRRRKLVFDEVPGLLTISEIRALMIGRSSSWTSSNASLQKISSGE